MKDGRVLGESGTRPDVKMGAHTEGVEAQRLLALAGNGNHDRGPFDLVRLPTGQPPVGVKQYLELRAGIDYRSCSDGRGSPLAMRPALVVAKAKKLPDKSQRSPSPNPVAR